MVVAPAVIVGAEGKAELPQQVPVLVPVPEESLMGLVPVLVPVPEESLLVPVLVPVQEPVPTPEPARSSHRLVVDS